jgi:hypothetical protein
MRFGADDTRVATLTDDTTGPARIREILLARREKPGLVGLDRGVKQRKFSMQDALPPGAAAPSVNPAMGVRHLEGQVLRRRSGVSRQPLPERRAP